MALGCGLLVVHLAVVLLCLFSSSPYNQVHGKHISNVTQHHQGRRSGRGRRSGGCDLFQGSWVFDDSYPIYSTKSCPFVGSGFDCQKNGRPDKQYLKYRWKPNGCDLVRFNGVDFLQRYRGKNIMFVGDSLSYNMWESLTCMLHSANPKSNYTLVTRGLLSTFSFPEYGVSVKMLKNGFLVDVVVDPKLGRILKLDSISRGDMWRGADVLIFNSFHWWTHSGRFQTWDYFQIGNKLIKEMDHLEAYKIGLTTWANWIATNINPSKTKVFFQGVSAVHTNAKEWNDPNPKARDCYRQTDPVQGSTYPGGVHPGETIVKNVLNSMKNKSIYLLDITLLTQLRKDGHPSYYAGNPKLRDCSHWCLAGVPNTWNQLLYAALVGNKKSRFTSFFN